MKVFVISDTHFNHNNIIKYCDRPFNNIKEMNDYMIKKWNSVINNDDMVIHLGDIGLGTKSDVYSCVVQLKGRKMLIKGNHDRLKDDDYLSMGFEKVSHFPIIWKNKIILSHEPLNMDTGSLVNIYGHIHNDEKYQNNISSICVCVERLDYTPLLIFDTNKQKWYI